MALRVRNLQVDVGPAAFDAALAFWADALGGVPRETDGTYVHLDGVRAPVGVHLPRLGEGQGALHLDLEPVPDGGTTEVGRRATAREVARLLELGADDLGPVVDGDHGERVLRDPAGLVFCVAVPGQRQQLSAVHVPSDLRMIVLDVPAEVRDATVAFWAAALGCEHGRARRFPAFSWVAGSRGPGGGAVTLLVQALGSDHDGPRLHVDLHVPDVAARDAEVDRLVALGASVERGPGDWVVLRVPGDTLLCVVPDEEG